jgi:tetratricopeptide (TPR) repeat protein
MGADALRLAYDADSAGREEEAVGHYRRAFELGVPAGELAGASLGFGSTLRNVGELDESVRVLSEAVERFPEHRALRVFLAYSLWSAGRQADAKGLLAAAIRDPDPVVVLEPKLIYRGEKQDVPEGEHVVPLGRARLAREGTDVTLVAYGAMVPVCERAAEALEDEASVEVLDLRSLRPLDEDALLASVSKTGRVVVVQEAPRTAGFGAEIAAILAEKAILDLHGPVLRVTGFDVPYPYWKIEDRYMPSVERVVGAARKLLSF